MFIEIVNESRKYKMCLVKCEGCATIRETDYNANRNKNIHLCKSCAAIKRSKTRNNTGESKTKLYKVYASMKSRCYNKMHKAYKHYGAKGVIICDEWLNDYQVFKNWAISNGYKSNDRKNNTIERINLSGHYGPYSPSNCKIASYKEQMNNTTASVKLKYTIEEFSDMFEMKEALKLTYIELGKLVGISERSLRKQHNGNK